MTQRQFKKDDHSFFQGIPQKERSTFRKKLLNIQQIKRQQPKFYTKQYPSCGKFTYKDFKLNYGYIQQSDKPQALIFFFHGMYCHGGDSGYLADVISQNIKDVNIYAIDFKNAGLSEGDCPGYYTIEQIEDQATKFVQFIQQRFRSNRKVPKLFIMGESMGGLLSFKLSVKYAQKYSGAVLLAPALRDCYENIPLLKKLGRVMGYLCPTFKMVPQDLVGFTRYQNFQYMKNQKRRYTDAHPPGTAHSILTQMDTCQKLFPKMTIPYLCIQGGVDKSVDLFGPIDLQKLSPSKDKTTLYYKQVWHEILIQEQIKQISQVISRWLKDRI